MDIVSPELIVLAASAGAIGFFHTMLGPDHYLPFVMMSRAGNWSQTKTAVITIFCGLGHIFGSLLLGMVGVAIGIAVVQLEQVESVRGTIAAWALIAFGLCYLVWGVYKAAIHKGTPHSIEKSGENSTPWALFTVFVLGPSEPLIPLLMYPAAKESVTAIVLVAGIFGVVTIATMLAMVALLSMGFDILPIGKLQRYSHALAGATICVCGLAIQFYGF